MWLFAIFVAIPIVEIALFIKVGGLIGLWPTLATVVLTAFAGATLMRIQGLGALARLQKSLEEGDDPRGPLAHGALILLAGALLLTPGFFTDAVGLALLIPPVRAALIAWAGPRLARDGSVRFESFGARRGGPSAARGGGPVIEGEYEEVGPEAGGPEDGEPDDDREPRRSGQSKWTRPPQ